MEEMQKIIKKYCLKNMYDYGSIKISSVVGKIIAENPEFKKNMKQVMEKIREISKEVEAMDKQQVEKEIGKYVFEKKEKKENEWNIANAQKGKVVVRFPPEPNGYPHIGHAKAFLLSNEIAEKYTGKKILRFDDTNPENESEIYIDEIKSGLKWLGINWDEEIYASDYIEKMYDLAKKLIESGYAYVCKCDKQDIKKNREKRKECVCRQRTNEENKLLFENMIKGKEEGILRLKADMRSDNTAMRDPTLFRIIKKEHYRQGAKYIVWPTYDFEGAVMDSLLGITHPIRSKEYELRDEVYFFILDKLNLRKPTLLTISRLNIKGNVVSKRKIKKLIEDGKIMSWDDPRLITLKALKRRGIQAEAIKKFVLSFGLSKVESNPSLDKLLSINRKIIDPISPRYYFVKDPVLIEINNFDKRIEIDLPLFPKKECKQFRKAIVEKQIYIQKSDVSKDFRLKGYMNVIQKQGKYLFDGNELRKNPKIQFVSKSNAIDCEIMVVKDPMNEKQEFDENSLIVEKGKCEKQCLNLKQGDIIQFERYGFCILDKKENGLRFIKIHD